ncbi:conserved exported hypothetical protein [Flavobacterium sp. 9AF]|uniref:hypothetical protein n=1 Tax=Flavobacterium sp. 9AF TaxID=2653142 RepID=UPI0012EEE91D|nr:hypothetical protein [Flavobacterium sp. 9AF]VXC09882.1 conserved exported hypothetical protein [Flavobacterium sp. 9AF]
MKNYTLLLFLLLFSFISNAQNNNYVGIYEKKIKTPKNEVFEYKLQILSDSTFTFHFFRNLGQSISKDENVYGKGTWKVIKNVIHFVTNTNHLNEKYTLNFTNSSGRFDSKNKNQFRFYHSEIPWIEKLTLQKVELHE